MALAMSKKKRRILSASLAAALGTFSVLCARQAGQALPLASGLWAAGSFVASPAAAAMAALRTLDDAVPRPEPPKADPSAPSTPALPAQAPEVPQQPAPKPSPSEPPAPEQEPPPEGAGRIITAHYQDGSGGAYVPCGSGSIKNCTALDNTEIAQTIAQGLPFSIEVNSNEPQVLIMHTHTTESYEDAPRSWYHPEATSRTTDPEKNVVAVGRAMAQQLNEAGIHTIQDATLHDYPSYNGSYARSHKTVEALLAQHPSIKVVLDVHRDAVIQQDGTWVKPIVELPDQGPCAQVMLICGADKGGNLPNFHQNLRFAGAWQSSMAQMYPGLARPVLFDYRYYNQDLTTGSLLIEVGGHANTLEEAVNAGTLAGKALAAALLAG